MADMELPDFLWQHQYNQHWVNYSIKDMKIINKAVKKWQKTVSLPSTDAKKNIVVYLDKMHQENKVSSRKQKIRCLVYNNVFCSWLWFDEDEGEWLSFKPRLVCFLEVALKRNIRMVKFYDNGDFKINLETFQQINETDQYKTAILRQDISPKEVLRSRDLEEKNEVFQSLCSDLNISFKKRLMNLPSMSSSILNMSCKEEQVDISNCAIATYQDEVIQEVDDVHLPVDIQCPDWKTYHIYVKDKVIYSATLNLVNVTSNINKFCILQVFEHKKKKQYAVWMRFGRLGSSGQTELVKYSNVAKAIKEFQERFFERTKNEWVNKSNFSRIPGKYDLLDIDLTPEKEEIPEVSDLDVSTVSLLELITDANTIDSIMRSLFCDCEIVPLGKLTFKQIKEGYVALKKIADVLTQNCVGGELIGVCEEFYTKIPHNFGKKSPPVIQTQEDIKKKLDLLESLWNLRTAKRALNAGLIAIQHPFNQYYNSFSCALQILDPENEKFAALDKCLQQTHGPTHAYSMEIIDAFQCIPEENIKTHKKSLLLWHGSRLTNWIGILKSGLHIAPTEAPSTGSMFGKGLYFADVSSKSANYCFATKKQNQGLILLCEVDVGNPLVLEDGQSVLPENLPPPCNSILGKGKFSPAKFESSVLSTKAKIPVGPLFEDDSFEGPLQYNEYVVYSSTLVTMKYLLRIKFHFK